MTFREYCKELGLVDDHEEILQAVSDYLEDVADETEAEEPYATNTIKRLREAAREVKSIVWYE